MMRAIAWISLAIASTGCVGVYTAPPVRSPEALTATPVPTGSTEPARAAIQRMESSCRDEVSGQLLQTSQQAIDRLRMALGTVCDLQGVGGDPLHWLFRCRYDAFFELGSYNFRRDRSADASCSVLPSVGSRGINRWACAGAVLEDIVRNAGDALQRVDVAVVGHVDEVCPTNSFRPCNELKTEFGYPSSVPWSDRSPTSPEEASMANSQLSWCRAASVGQKLQCGIQLARDPAAAASRSGDPCAHVSASRGDEKVTYAFLGAGTAWQQDHESECGPATASSTPGYCDAARRVDVFVRFVAPPRRTTTTCSQSSRDANGALYCLEECVSQRGTRGGGPTTPSVPLRVESGRVASTLSQARWLCMARAGSQNSSDCDVLNVDAIRGMLQISRVSPSLCRNDVR